MSLMVAEKISVEFYGNSLAVTYSPPSFTVKARADWSQSMISLLATSTIRTRGLYSKLSQIAYFSGVSWSLACLRMVSTSVGKPLSKRMIMSMEIPFLLNLLWNPCLGWILAVAFVTASKRASAKLEIIPTIYWKFLESCELSTDEKAISSTWTWRKLSIDAVGLGQKDHASVYSIDPSLFELRLCH